MTPELEIRQTWDQNLIKNFRDSCLCTIIGVSALRAANMRRESKVHRPAVAESEVGPQAGEISIG